MEKKYNREYKSTLFSLMYGENKEYLLDLCNAVNGTSYENAEEIEYTTLDTDRGFFMRMKNDLSFIIDRTLSVYEHQSSPTSANITLRILHYYSDLLRRMIDRKSLYREKPVKIPVPQFIVFYNGKEDQPDETVFHLSDLFERRTASPGIELCVRMLNINFGRNRELLEKCTSLAQYAEFVRRMRTALENVQDKAQRWKTAEDVIDRSIRDGILSEVLRRYKSEVIEMYYWEYDEEAHRWAIEQDAMEKGLAKGMEQGLQQGMEQGLQQGMEQGLQQGIEQGLQQGIEQGIEQGLEQGLQQGLQQGVQRGREEGHTLELIRIIIKKVRKGKTLSEIIDDLESDEETIRPLWESVQAEAPDYDEHAVFQRFIRDQQDPEEVTAAVTE